MISPKSAYTLAQGGVKQGIPDARGVVEKPPGAVLDSATQSISTRGSRFRNRLSFPELFMQALILAGGKGTRLRPLTVYTPKPVVPVCNRPFLLYQLDTLRRAGVTDVTLSLSYQPHKIEQQLGDGSDYGVHINYMVEPQPQGTAGAYKFAEDLIREPTVVFNGDIVTDLDLRAVIREHDGRGAVATVVLAPVENPCAYGVVEADGGGRVTRFAEKPGAEECGVNTINAGTYILDPKVLDFIPEGESYSF